MGKHLETDGANAAHGQAASAKGNPRVKPYNAYDRLARVYNQHWGDLVPAVYPTSSIWCWTASRLNVPSWISAAVSAISPQNSRGEDIA